MEEMVTTTEDGKSQTLVGITICKGPGRHRMILTRPYHEAGQIVEIPSQDIESIEPVAPGALGEIPQRSTTPSRSPAVRKPPSR